jgi:histidinol dehydrogenase
MQVQEMEIKNLRDLSAQEKNALFNRFGSDFMTTMVETVVPIVDDVRKRGDEAVRDYCLKFDGAELPSLMATDAEIEEGYKNTSREAVRAFSLARDNIVEYHKRQLRESYEYEREGSGTFGMKYHPVESAAIYVPGGKAAYPSSVLMGLVPAQIAGVKDLMLITPVKKDGKIPDAVCAVCRILGVNNILKAGGAQGIAAAGFGTETVKKAQIIVGPGNIFVTAAKSYLFSLGIVQIDSLAGPSETLVIADDSVNPKWTAYDLLSQAEHEENARAVLVGLSGEYVRDVVAEIEKNLSEGKGRISIKKTSVQRHFKAFVADSVQEAVEFANKYAPEHMQIMVRNAKSYLPSIRNVGSLFIGAYSPVSVGDYFSGTNHVLPTGGACRFSSGLSVETFCRRTTYQMLSREGLERAVEPVTVMSELEGFGDMHGGSLRVRFE